MNILVKFVYSQNVRNTETNYPDNCISFLNKVLDKPKTGFLWRKLSSNGKGLYIEMKFQNLRLKAMTRRQVFEHNYFYLNINEFWLS